jgi:hypothetical protein
MVTKAVREAVCGKRATEARGGAKSPAFVVFFYVSRRKWLKR